MCLFSPGIVELGRVFANSWRAMPSALIHDPHILSFWVMAAM